MKALVLCAGFGTRLGDVTRDVPKPLLDVGGACILEHILANIAAAGIRDVLINLHFHPEAIPAKVGNGSRYGLNIQYVREEALLGTAGTLKSVREYFNGEPALVHYGDIVTDHSLRDLADEHDGKKALVTMLVHERAGSNSAAYIEPDGRVSKFLERPKTAPQVNADGKHWVFSGICIVAPEVELPGHVPADLPRDLFPSLTQTDRLYAHKLRGYRCAIDSVDRLDAARRAVGGEFQSRFPLSQTSREGEVGHAS